MFSVVSLVLGTTTLSKLSETTIHFDLTDRGLRGAVNLTQSIRNRTLVPKDFSPSFYGQSLSTDTTAVNALPPFSKTPVMKIPASTAQVEKELSTRSN